ncbi:hypothetical protein WJX74_000846 [Apatococcus lobatus]|uniref:Inositol-1-monophosphatase n=1 Tax=Apatococcus lobatus TaxID=904363 RepID=A0AAW1S9D4_9CHLO
MESKQAYLDVASRAALQAGEVITAAFSEQKAVEFKGKVDLVTETDKQCEKLILTALRQAFPSHHFIGEEGSAAQGFTAELTDEPTWLVDPVDGTTNFVHRWPFVCVSIGLAIKKELTVGVVYNPVMNEMYTAVRGTGAFLNSKPISVSQTAQLGASLVATEIGTTRDSETVAAIFDRISAVTAQVRSIRCNGSCALNLCSVASGRLDGFYEIGFGGPWDVAAAALIVQEAGGHILDPNGSPFHVMARRVLAANPRIASSLAGILAKCKVSQAEPGPLT